MDKRTQGLRGSPARDAFKLRHKQPPFKRGFYACDIDFLFVDKKPAPSIIAVLDYKQPRDSISFTETIAYNQFLAWGIDVYIVVSQWHGIDAQEEFTHFTVKKYLGGNWRPYPPTSELEIIGENMTVEQFAEWENCVRKR